MNQDYKKIQSHYESCLFQHGDSAKGMDWPNIEGMLTRFKVMSDLVKDDGSCRLLDLGCGTGAFYQYLKLHKPNINYSGADISINFIDLCKKKYPGVNFKQVDILTEPSGSGFWYPKSDSLPLVVNKETGQTQQQLDIYDYVVMNGIFTVKKELTQESMLDFLAQMIVTTWLNVKKGIAFNVMSDQVDWKRDDLFHLPFDALANFIIKTLGTRNFTFRNDYGLYEYTTYIYK